MSAKNKVWSKLLNCWTKWMTFYSYINDYCPITNNGQSGIWFCYYLSLWYSHFLWVWNILNGNYVELCLLRIIVSFCGTYAKHSLFTLSLGVEPKYCRSNRQATFWLTTWISRLPNFELLIRQRGEQKFIHPSLMQCHLVPQQLWILEHRFWPSVYSTARQIVSSHYAHSYIYRRISS